jgi:hypothetical protein
MERQRFEAVHLGKSCGYASSMIYNRTTRRFSRQICSWQDCNHVPKRASTERQRLLHWHLEWYNRNRRQINQNESIGCLNWQKCKGRYRVRLLQLCAHGGSRLWTLHSNKLPYAVPKWRFTRSVVAICPCIHHNKYACNVWLIRLLSL